MQKSLLARALRVAAVSLLFLATFQLAPAEANATGLSIQNLTKWSAASGGNDHYYGYVSFADISFTDASTLASAEVLSGFTGYLTTITSAAEQSFVQANVLPADQEAPADYYIAGAAQAPNQFLPTGGWSWGSGEAWGYTNWAPGQPDGGFNQPDAFLSVMVNLSRGKWADEPHQSASTTGFLIEFDGGSIQLPEPDAALLLAGALAAMALVRRT